MIRHPTAYRSLPLGVVLRRRPGVTRWQKHSWTACSVLPGAKPAEWRELWRDGDVVEFHAATVPLELHGAETEAYVQNLQTDQPSIYALLRESSDSDRPLDVTLVTASPFEGQDYADTGEDIVEKIAMPYGLIAWVADFIDAFHSQEPFVKRKRDKKRIDLVEDGIGDVRIAQPADVYRSPSVARKERLQ